VSWLVYLACTLKEARAAHEAFTPDVLPSRPWEVTSTPDAALKAARSLYAGLDSDERLRRAVLVKQQGGRPRWFLWRGQLWGVGENGRLEGQR
jgi:hypothetical protein